MGIFTHRQTVLFEYSAKSFIVFFLCCRSLDCSYNISYYIQYVNRQLENPCFWLAYVSLYSKKRDRRGVFYKKFSVKNSLFLVVTFCSSPLTNRPIEPLRTAPTPLKNPAPSHSASSDLQISFCPSFYAQQSTLILSQFTNPAHNPCNILRKIHIQRTSSHCTNRKKSLAISKNA